MKSESPDSQAATPLPGAAATKPLIRFGFAFSVTATVAATGSVLLCMKASPFFAGLFFLPFAFGPLAITVALCFAFRSTPAQRLLAVSSVLYGVWFGYVYLNAFYLNPDPQSAIAFLFIGVYAFPVLILFWIAAGVIQRRSTDESGKRSDRHGSTRMAKLAKLMTTDVHHLRCLICQLSRLKRRRSSSPVVTGAML